MKKFFTLIAATLMVAGANAQGSFRFAENQTPTSKQEITSVPNITVVMGEDTWAAAKAEHPGDLAETDFVAYTTGSNNPTDANGKKPGQTTFDATTAKGCVVHFKPAVNGHLVIGVKQNKGKDKTLYLFEDAQTEVVAHAGAQDDSSWYGTIEADVKAGKNYCLYQGATKLGFFGFDFTVTEGGDDEPVEVAAEEYFLSLDGCTLSKRGTGDKDPENIATWENGCKLELTGKDDKAYSGAKKITIDGAEYTTIKLSNGAQNTVTLPEGKKATKVTFYSYVNKSTADNGETKNYWQEVAGTAYAEADATLMADFNDITDYQKTPDAISFDLDKVNEFTFTNKGNQPCVVIYIALEKEESGETNAINTVKTATIDLNAPVYNLAGQRVGNDYKGIVIKNGVKMVQK